MSRPYKLVVEPAKCSVAVSLSTLETGDVCEDADRDVFLVGEGGYDDLIVLGGPNLDVGSRYTDHPPGTMVTPRVAKLVIEK